MQVGGGAENVGRRLDRVREAGELQSLAWGAWRGLGGLAPNNKGGITVEGSRQVTPGAVARGSGQCFLYLSLLPLP